MTRTRFLTLFSLAVFSAGFAFIVHLALRTRNVAIGYDVERARREGGRLRGEINQARLELGVRRSPTTLEAEARARGMVEPDRVPTVVVGGAVRPPRLSGRPR
ncbi:MAG: hypothetical protein JNK72_04860 [Myxococcales bacterium]|nr:hypothetical protein [Myxococcales bacterium]